MAKMILKAQLTDIPVELLLLIGRYLESHTLSQLCRTNRLLHGLFKPLLYRQVFLTTKDQGEGNLYLGIESLANLKAEFKHCRIKELIIETPMLCDLPMSAARNRRDNRLHYNKLFRRSLENCGSLEKLVYAVGETKQKTVDAMKILPALRYFAYTFVGEHHRDWPEIEWRADSSDENEIADKEDEFSFRPMSLIGFQNLSSLHLYDLYPCLSSFQRDIVQILLDSPQISDLALSIMSRNDVLQMECDSQHHLDDDPSHINFWEQVCVTYATRAQGYRLNIEKLHLGSGIYLEAFANYNDKAENNYITRIFNLTALQVLRYDNVPGNSTEIVFDHIAFDGRWDYLDMATELIDIRAETITSTMLAFFRSPRRKQGKLKRLAIGFAPSEDYPMEDRQLLKDILATEAVEGARIVFGDLQGNLPEESTYLRK